MAEILVLTAGSTGDVEPFAALAARLATRGHAVTFAADARFSKVAPGSDGICFAPIRADFRSLLPTPDRKKPSLRKDVFPVIRGMLEDSWKVAKAHPPDVIVAHQKTLAAPHLAEKLGIPHVQALTVPMLTPTQAFPLPGVVNRDLGGMLNRASYRLLALLTLPYAGLIRDWRDKHLSLAPRGTPSRPAKTLYCYSPTVVPTPHDWPPQAVATGYWLSEDRDQPIDPELEAFVAAGEPPVYVGFGSSVGPDATQLSRSVDQALQMTGVRAVIATGWGGLANQAWNDDALVVEQVSHTWLLPQVAAVVHHGGAGTTAAGLRAGRPSIVCPFQGDQYFWGRAVRQAGAGPQPSPAKRLTAERLSVAIRTALEDGAMRGRATELSERLAREVGTERASEEIEASLPG